jgi:hypothetical protein
MRTRPAILTATLVLALTAAPAVPAATAQAPADSPSSTATRSDALARFQERAYRAIDRRLTALDRAQGRIDASTHVTDEHERALTDLVTANEDGLTSLRDQIAAATTLREAVAEAEKIVTEHWIFARVIPQVGLTLASDHAVDGAARILERSADVRARIEDLADPNDPDVPQALAALDDLDAAADGLSTTAAGIPGTVLVIEPGAMPEARSTLVDARQSLGDALRDLRDAIRTARDEVGDLIG